MGTPMVKGLCVAWVTMIGNRAISNIIAACESSYVATQADPISQDFMS